MPNYNAPFFNSITNTFLIYKELHGEERSLEFLAELMGRTLGASFKALGLTKGDPRSFVDVIRARDEAVGLRVSFPDISDTQIVYRFHTDPFPRLKDYVDPYKLDATYMKFKVSYLLGEEWTYDTTSHLWRCTPFTEHVITKKA